MSVPPRHAAATAAPAPSSRGRAWQLLRRPYRRLERLARGRPFLQRVVRTIGAATRVRETLRFLLGELGRSERAGVYRLRQSGLRVIVRQPMIDMFVLEEVFRLRPYELPAPVKENLASLGRRPRVLDLGAHVGMFGLFAFAELNRPEVTSYEPDPEAFAVLERCRSENRLERDWRLEPAFASHKDGEVDFLPAHSLGRAADAGSDLYATRAWVQELFPFLPEHALAPGDVVAVMTRDVLPELERADLAKIDIEGAEWALLRDSRFVNASPAVLTLELHASGAGRDNFALEGRRLLESAGYTVDGPRGASADAATIWAWRESTPVR